MSRAFVAASSRYLEVSITSQSPIGYSFSAWCFPTQTTADQAIAGFGQVGTTGNSVHLIVAGAQAGDPVRIVAGGQVASSSTGYTANVWHHVGGYARATSGTDARGVYLNGGSKGTSTSLSTPDNATRIMVGRRTGSTPNSYFDGRIAEVAIWSAVLTDAQFLALANGVPAWLIQPAALFGYWPIWGDDSPEPDWSGAARQLTVTNSPARGADHAPVTPFSDGLWIPVGGAPGIAAPLTPFPPWEPRPTTLLSM